jgi:anti-anti-sigma regulatory factor
MLVFLYRMSRSVVRRAYRGDLVRSRRMREPRLAEFLARHGAAILVVELEGPLFFGTAENLGAYLEAAAGADVAYVVLDFKRVSEIDSTGAKVVLNAHQRLAKQKKILLLSSVEPDSHAAHVLADLGIAAALTDEHQFPDADHAIEWAEDRLIESHAGEAGFSPSKMALIEGKTELPLRQLDVFAHLGNADHAILRTLVQRRTWQKGEILFRENDASNELYAIALGSASARIRLPGTNRETRLAAFSAGTVFGEVALLDRAARSATVRADEDLVCYVLTHANYLALTRDHPELAIRLLTNLGREISRNLRRSTQTIYQLSI